ncbi:MAG: HPr(Ser) kinase/phosphatase [Alicyclobacillaceae bacterium]|nr:HPr(Ser) kinase/phosphatase [Alicyclobacillaceae bacterium]
MEPLRVADIVRAFGLEVLAGSSGLDTVVRQAGVNRPGLELIGYFDYFDPFKIQLLGKKETAYLVRLSSNDRYQAIQRLIERSVPAVIFTEGIRTLQLFIELCNAYGTPLLRTNRDTTEFSLGLHTYLLERLAPEIGLHGTMVELFGVGIILRGVSGIGKSEVALSLIERGHLFVADDMIVVRRVGSRLLASASPINEHFLSIRGAGLLNVRELYGIGSIRESAEINLEVELVPWVDRTDYDALGLEDQTVSYLGIPVPKITIPVKPGRDIAEIVQVAAKNHRLQATGYNAKHDLFSRVRAPR